MKRSVGLFFLFVSGIAFALHPYKTSVRVPQKVDGKKLVFSEEFNYKGKPDTTIWNFEQGFKRNHELQWYQSDNASCIDGRLIIEGRKENFPNPDFVAGSKDWRKNRELVNFTSSSITTAGKKSWLYGRFEVRARIDTTMGSWPAVWLLGSGSEWPSCGEIDMMEFYRYNNQSTIMANVGWGSKVRYKPVWNNFRIPLTDLLRKDKNWVKKYHVWRMDRTPAEIRLFVDDVLYNTTSLSETINADGSNPFTKPMYLILNLALGSNGGTPDVTKFPLIFEIDYVRVYQ